MKALPKNPIIKRAIRYWSIAAVLAVALLCPPGSAQRKAYAQSEAPFRLEEATLTDIQNALTSGKITSRQLVLQYIKRISAYDGQGPSLNAILEINPDALKIADELDQERKAKGVRGPLHGIPVILKDNINTADRMTTTSGSLSMLGAVAGKDAFVVQKLRSAGAIPLAKANMDEFAVMENGFSSRGGQTLNPYAPGKSPGGSSGGTAVAVTSNYGAFGLGSDTGGSIRIPCSFNSLVGLRPTMGLIGRTGVAPLARTQDTVGPVTRTVADAAIVLDALAGYDPGDPITKNAVGKIPETYTGYLQADGLRGARIGVVRSMFGDKSKEIAVDDVINNAISEMKRLGAVIVDSIELPNLDELMTYPSRSTWEFKFNLNDYLKEFGPGAPVKSLKDIIDLGLYAPVLKDSLIAREAKKGLGYTDYLDNIENTAALSQGDILKAMDENKLDILIYPATRRPPETIGKGQLGRNAMLAAFSGFPALAVPAGFTTDGLPVDVEFLGRPYSEPTLLKLGYSFEQGTQFRRPPSLPIR